MIVNNTEDKKRERLLTNYDENVLVMAGAGAGKTTMIIGRVINQLKSGWIKPEELVVITFTKAAAGELRDRLTRDLATALKNATNPTEKEYLKNAVENQALIQVSTIHSFCLKLIKERALDINYPLDVEMIDEVETENRKRNFFSNWIKNLNDSDKKAVKEYSSEFYLKDFLSFVYNTFVSISELSPEIKIKYNEEYLPNGKKHRSTKEYLDDMYNQADLFISKSEDYVKLHKGQISDEETEKLASAWIKRIAKAKYISTDEFVKEYKKIYGTGTTIENTTNVKEVYNPVQNGGIIKLADGRSIKHKDNLDYSDYEDLIYEKNYYNDFSLYQNALVVDIAVRAQKAYQEFLNQPENKHKLSNDQLLNLAYELVSNHEDARKFFKSHIKYLYIDEYQDTDFIQRGLAYKLGQDENGNFEDSRLFFCGDAKQAIYAFRGADLNVYQSTYDTFSDNNLKNCFVYSLQYNFRSQKTIIDWVNTEFASGHGIKDYEPMIATKNVPVSDYHILNGVYTLAVPNDKKNKNEAKNAETEAVFIAKLINYLVDAKNGYKLNRAIKDKNGKILKYEPGNIEYKDFLIISKGKSNLTTISKTLKYFNIPIIMNGALNFSVDDTAVKFKTLYHYLINKDDKKAAYAAKQVIMQEAVFEDKELAEKRLEALSKMCEGKEPFELIEYLVHRADLFMNDITPASEVKNIELHLQQILEYLLSLDKLTYEGYDEAITSLMNSSLDKELVPSSDSNSVRIMNRHKSKGLQGGIVISCLRTQETDNPASYRELKGKDYYIYPTVINEKTNIPAYINSEGSVQAISRALEKTRLEYVEATRAEECIIFLDNLTNKKSRFDNFNFSKENNVTKLSDIQEFKDLYDKYYKSKTSLSENKYKKGKMPNNEIPVELSPEQTETQMESVTPSSKDNYDANDWSKVQKAKDNRPDGNIFGTVLHRMFELAINQRDNVNIDLCVNQAMMESIADIKDEEKNVYVSYLREQLNKFIKSDVFKLVNEAKEVYSEYEFSYIENKEWINGKADLVLVFDNEIKIIDYKTDKIPTGANAKELLEQHLEDAYGDQQRLYCKAISKCFGITNVNYQFYHMYM